MSPQIYVGEDIKIIFGYPIKIYLILSNNIGI